MATLTGSPAGSAVTPSSTGGTGDLYCRICGFLPILAIFFRIGKTAPVHIHRKSLRTLRELRGLNALELAERVGCPVGVVIRAEMGLQLPVSRAEQARLAAAYGLHPREFVRLALDEADRLERGKTR